jgi:Asp-tRNA(Asn)/Glu-tRNA(Gln) amidotransferase A subunit family amidase
MTDLLDQGAAAIPSAIQAVRTSGRDGLPIGLQIVAPRLHDRPLPAMAQRAEAALA